MRAPLLMAFLKPAYSLQLSAGSAQMKPLVEHQCCGPAILIVGLFGGYGDFAVTDEATDGPAWLAITARGTTTTTAAMPARSVRLIRNPLESTESQAPLLYG